MHPAYSVIFFTTSSGAGYGLLALLGAMNWAGWLPADRWFGLTGVLTSLGLISFGLLSSTFHLGHPGRSWRALSQWRSSWLSREGVVAVITYAPAAVFAIGWGILGEPGGLSAWSGGLAVAGAVATVYCTSMIYVSLRPIANWNNPWASPIYLTLALGTGAIWLDGLGRAFGQGRDLVTLLVIVGAGAGWLLKAGYWKAMDAKTPGSSLGTATGLGMERRARVLDPPHTSENYLQWEMGYRVARKHALKLRRLAMATLFALPMASGVLILLFPPAGTGLAVLSILSAGIGVLIERWLFFAEARHVVGLYYGEEI